MRPFFRRVCRAEIVPYIDVERGAAPITSIRLVIDSGQPEWCRSCESETPPMASMRPFFPVCASPVDLNDHSYFNGFNGLCRVARLEKAARSEAFVW